jgi:aspartate racemase
MKLIGLLGGTSWPSTISYYENLNRLAQQRLGGTHSARLLLYSIDYHAIKSQYQGGWHNIPALLADEIRNFLERRPDCLIICNNTLHKAYDLIAAELDIRIPVFHAGRLAAQDAKQRGMKTVLLLGTAFTMEDGFFARYFDELGIAVIIPSPEERKQIQTMQTELAAGKMHPSYQPAFQEILKRYPQAEATVLACTELPLVINVENSPLPLINPVDCQCLAAADFALAG